MEPQGPENKLNGRYRPYWIFAQVVLGIAVLSLFIQVAQEANIALNSNIAITAYVVFALLLAIFPVRKAVRKEIAFIRAEGEKRSLHKGI